MPAPSPAPSIESHGCTARVRRFSGPEALELFVGLEPPDGARDAGEQARALVRAMLEIVAAEGGRFGAVMSETLFLRDAGARCG